MSCSAISIDSDLRFGVSKSCNTFGSPKLTREEDFEIVSAELWTIDSSYSQVLDMVQQDNQPLQSLLMPAQPHRDMQIKEVHAVDFEPMASSNIIIRTGQQDNL